MYVKPLMPYWNGVVKRMYSGAYQVNFTMPNEATRDFLDVRYDHDFISFAFKYIGYLTLVELIVVTLYGISLALEYFYTVRFEEKTEDKFSFGNPGYIFDEGLEQVIHLTDLISLKERNGSCHSRREVVETASTSEGARFDSAPSQSVFGYAEDKSGGKHPDSKWKAQEIS